jgi:hypothetical protein
MELDKVFVFNSEGLLEHCKEATAKFREQYYPEATEAEGPRDPAAVRVDEYLMENSDVFGGYREDVIALMEALVGESLRAQYKAGSKVSYLHHGFAVVVPRGNSNSHNYPLGEPVMMMFNGTGLRRDFTMGNNLTEYWKEVRPATDEEIEGFIADLEAKRHSGAYKVIAEAVYRQS